MIELANKIELVSFNQTDINSFNEIMLPHLTVQKSDSQEVMKEKLNALRLFRSFIGESVPFKKLDTREAKVAYMKFVDNLNQQIEHLQIQTGERTIESIQRAGRRFAKKTQFPLGIILE